MKGLAMAGMFMELDLGGRWLAKRDRARGVAAIAIVVVWFTACGKRLPPAAYGVDSGADADSARVQEIADSGQTKEVAPDGSRSPEVDSTADGELSQDAQASDEDASLDGNAADVVEVGDVAADSFEVLQDGSDGDAGADVPPGPPPAECTTTTASPPPEIGTPCAVAGATRCIDAGARKVQWPANSSTSFPVVIGCAPTWMATCGKAGDGQLRWIASSCAGMAADSCTSFSKWMPKEHQYVECREDAGGASCCPSRLNGQPYTRSNCHHSQAGTRLCPPAWECSSQAKGPSGSNEAFYAGSEAMVACMAKYSKCTYWYPITLDKTKVQDWYLNCESPTPPGDKPTYFMADKTCVIKDGKWAWAETCEDMGQKSWKDE